MYKIELTEKEIKQIGVNRYITPRWKRRIISFAVGLGVLVIGAYNYDLTIGKVLMFGGGTIWIAYLFLEAKKEGREGVKFFEKVKNDENNS